MSMSPYRRYQHKYISHNNLSEIREALYSTGLFFERANGSFYLGENIRVNVRVKRETMWASPGVPRTDSEYVMYWEIYREGVRNKYVGRKRVQVRVKDWFKISIEELLSTVDKETAKNLAFNLDVLL